VNTAPRSSDRCQRIIDLIDDCLADYAASLRAAAVRAEARPRRAAR
jgi:hypothetical protein